MMADLYDLLEKEENLLADITLYRFDIEQRECDDHIDDLREVEQKLRKVRKKIIKKLKKELKERLSYLKD